MNQSSPVVTMNTRRLNAIAIDTQAVAGGQDELYFDALQSAALLAPEYFGGRAQLLAASCADQIKPEWLKLRDALPLMPEGQEAYLIALASYIHEPSAARLAGGTVSLLPGRLARVMDQTQKRALARLLSVHPMKA